MDVQEAQESQPKVMEAIGQNCEVHQGVERFGNVHAESRQAGTSLRLSSMETGPAMIWTGSQLLVDI